jgi:hypothetical protein
MCEVRAASREVEIPCRWDTAAVTRAEEGSLNFLERADRQLVLAPSGVRAAVRWSCSHTLLIGRCSRSSSSSNITQLRNCYLLPERAEPCNKPTGLTGNQPPPLLFFVLCRWLLLGLQSKFIVLLEALFIWAE